MSDRELDHLRTVVGNLQRRIEALEARLALMPEADLSYDDAANGAVALASPHDQDLRPAAVRAFFLLGRSILVLAGGFLLRALTEGGTLPPAVGFAAGVLYLLGLAFFIDRAGRREDSAGASALGITAVVVAYPPLCTPGVPRSVATGAAGRSALLLLLLLLRSTQRLHGPGGG